MSRLEQSTQPFIAQGNIPMPVLAPVWGGSKKVALTTTPSAELLMHSSTFPRVIRIWSVGCASIYRLGATGMAAPAASGVDGFVSQDGVVEVVANEDENYLRIAADSGTGSARIELLR